MILDQSQNQENDFERHSSDQNNLTNLEFSRELKSKGNFELRANPR